MIRLWCRLFGHRVVAMRRALQVIHPSSFMQEELDARGWSRDRLAVEMGGDAGLNRIAIDMYFELGPSHSDLRLGSDEAAGFARAFGTSEELWTNLERSWLLALSAAGEHVKP